MKDSDPFETELKKRFASLRRTETEATPPFVRMTSTLHRGQPDPGHTSRRLRAFPFLVPIAALAILTLVIIPVLVNRSSARTSLTSSMPVLLEDDPGQTALFAGIPTSGNSGFLPSDDLLPLQLRIKL